MKKIDCARHPGVPALEQCGTCQRVWCHGCIARVTHANRTLTGCPLCHTALQPINRETAVQTRTIPSLSDLLRRPFRLEPVLTAVAISVPVWLAWVPVFGTLFSLIGFAAAVAYYFQVIDHVGRGETGMPEPTQIIEDANDILKFTIRGLLCLLVGTLPFLVWYYVFREDQEAGAGLIWLVAGQLYMPAALLTVVITGSTAGALWPVAWLQVAGRAPLEYLRLVGVFLVSIVVGWYANGIFRSATSFIPIVGSLIALTLERLLWFTQAALVGGFLARNAEKLGWD